MEVRLVAHTHDPHPMLSLVVESCSCPELLTVLNEIGVKMRARVISGRLSKGQVDIVMIPNDVD